MAGTQEICPGREEFEPKFRLAELGMNRRITEIIEHYAITKLIEVEKTGKLADELGLDMMDSYALSGALRATASRGTYSARFGTDPGMRRVMREIGRVANFKYREYGKTSSLYAPHIRLEADFYEVTSEKEVTIRSILQSKNAHHSKIAHQLFQFHFGLDDQPERSLRECIKTAEFGGYTAYSLGVIIQDNLELLAAHLVPIYGTKKYPNPADLHVDYLQLTPRTRNILVKNRHEMIESLITKTRAGLMRVPKLGRVALDEIEHALEVCGFSLAIC